jgi:hypothetical protein
MAAVDDFPDTDRLYEDNSDAIFLLDKVSVESNTFSSLPGANPTIVSYKLQRRRYKNHE